MIEKSKNKNNPETQSIKIIFSNIFISILLKLTN